MINDFISKLEGYFLANLLKTDNTSFVQNSVNMVVVGGSKSFYQKIIIDIILAKAIGVNHITVFLPPIQRERVWHRLQELFIQFSFDLNQITLKTMVFNEIGLYDVYDIHKEMKESDILLIGSNLGTSFDVNKVVLSVISGILNKLVILHQDAISLEVFKVFQKERHNWLLYLIETHDLTHGYAISDLLKLSDHYNMNVLLEEKDYITLIKNDKNYSIFFTKAQNLIFNLKNYIGKVTIKD